MFVFGFTFGWSLLPGVQLIINQYWFGWWLGADKATCHYLNQLEILDQWSTRIPPSHRRGWQWVDCNWTLFKITSEPFWKRHSWQSLGFCLQPQRTCTWNFKSKLELRCRNHAIQKPKNIIWPPGSHLENEVTENQTDKVNPVPPPPTSLGVGRGYNNDSGNWCHYVSQGHID